MYFQHDFEVQRLWLNPRVPSHKGNPSLGFSAAFPSPGPPGKSGTFSGYFKVKKSCSQSPARLSFDKRFFRHQMEELKLSFGEVCEESASNLHSSIHRTSERSLDPLSLSQFSGKKQKSVCDFVSSGDLAKSPFARDFGTELRADPKKAHRPPRVKTHLLRTSSEQPFLLGPKRRFLKNAQSFA